MYALGKSAKTCPSIVRLLNLLMQVGPLVRSNHLTAWIRASFDAKSCKAASHFLKEDSSQYHKKFIGHPGANSTRYHKFLVAKPLLLLGVSSVIVGDKWHGFFRIICMVHLTIKPHAHIKEDDGLEQRAVICCREYG